VRAQTKIVYLLGAALAVGILGCSNQNSSLVAAQNKSAALTGDLPFNPLQGKVITSWIDKQNSTMSTLYGNDLAVHYARSNKEHNYPPGSVLSVVTWKQQEDPRWFGARIPATVKSVEYVMVKTASNQKPSYSYEKYEGSPLKRTVDQEGPAPNDAATRLLAQRAAVMP
jgi:hypothetical protein